jgi:hypothetical protein
MRVEKMLLDDNGATYIISGVKFRYRVEQISNIKVGQEVEFTELTRKTRPYLIMSKETQEQMEG